MTELQFPEAEKRFKLRASTESFTVKVLNVVIIISAGAYLLGVTLSFTYLVDDGLIKKEMSDIGEHDRIILNSIFNPFLPIGESNYDGDLAEELIDNEEITASVLRAKEIELEGVKAADAGDLLRAERLFTEALSVADRASGYNNRAQVLRLQGRDGAAFLDLNKAVEVSGGRGKAGCQAYCQRALLHRRNGRDSEAKDDFTMAAQLGSSFAKQQLVEMNPYAAMCNQMLNDMMAKLTK